MFYWNTNEKKYDRMHTPDTITLDKKLIERFLDIVFLLHVYLGEINYAWRHQIGLQNYWKPFVVFTCTLQ